MCPEAAIKIVRSIYEWGCAVGKNEIPLRSSDAAEFITDSCVFVINNVVKTAGVDGLIERIEDMKRQTKSFDARVLEPCFSDGERVAGYGQYRFEMKNGEKGLIHTCTVWTLSEGRIGHICEVAFFEGVPLELGSFGEGAGATSISA